MYTPVMEMDGNLFLIGKIDTSRIFCLFRKVDSLELKENNMTLMTLTDMHVPLPVKFYTSARICRCITKQKQQTLSKR